jgi:hypothetical protein
VVDAFVRDAAAGIYVVRSSGISTLRRDFAADSLQVQRCPIADPIFD